MMVLVSYGLNAKTVEVDAELTERLTGLKATGFIATLFLKGLLPDGGIELFVSVRDAYFKHQSVVVEVTYAGK